MDCDTVNKQNPYYADVGCTNKYIEGGKVDKLVVNCPILCSSLGCAGTQIVCPSNVKAISIDRTALITKFKEVI